MKVILSPPTCCCRFVHCVGQGRLLPRNLTNDAPEQQPSSHPHPRPPLSGTDAGNRSSRILTGHSTTPRITAPSIYKQFCQFPDRRFCAKGKKNIPLTLSAIRARNFEDGDVPAHPFLRRRSGCRGADDKCERLTVRTE
ncbi:hypothetical protein CEXT_714841 [Caerostris extrusa]|uniref:Uncharacterized protein n=1 Tax=Caerostris extrusa TaxID=172846 RepID=A0AAV4XT43_CAEEX|nr:hypothetical protein CEXT_714841 [Caerostris extrusa]